MKCNSRTVCLVSFQGQVTFTNAGTFTAYDACTINGTSTDSFTNTGTFTCGGVDTNVSIALNLAFTNSNTVNIQAGVLSVQSGVSTGAWNISNGAALNVVGASSAQVYTLNAGTTFAAAGALFVIDTEVHGQDQIPVLARPLNITGKLGWVGSIGSMSVGLGQTTPLTLVNSQTMIESMTLADIPEPQQQS